MVENIKNGLIICASAIFEAHLMFCKWQMHVYAADNRTRKVTCGDHVKPCFPFLKYTFLSTNLCFLSPWSFILLMSILTPFFVFLFQKISISFTGILLFFFSFLREFWYLSQVFFRCLFCHFFLIISSQSFNNFTYNKKCYIKN